MVNVTVVCVNEDAVKARLGTLANQSGKIIARAANSSYNTGKNAVSREAAKDYLIRQKDINDKNTLKITKAKASNPLVTLVYMGHHRNLYLWNNKKAVVPNKIIHWSMGKKGLKPNVKIYKAAVMRGHGKIKLGGKNKPFIQRVRKGENAEFVGLFRREDTSNKAPLEGVSASSIPQILKNDNILEMFGKSAGPKFLERLEHEIDLALKGVEND